MKRIIAVIMISTNILGMEHAIVISTSAKRKLAAASNQETNKRACLDSRDYQRPDVPGDDLNDVLGASKSSPKTLKYDPVYENEMNPEGVHARRELISRLNAIYNSPTYINNQKLVLLLEEKKKNSVLNATERGQLALAERELGLTIIAVNKAHNVFYNKKKYKLKKKNS